jgi:poly(3-hydroxybutyrate) depolymerase
LTRGRLSDGNTLAACLFSLSLASYILAPLAYSETFFPPGRHKITFKSSYDSTSQTAYIIVPQSAKRSSAAFPVVVALHTWSANVEQRDMYGELERQAQKRGWLYLFPDFRGANNHPLACGSNAACRDVIDALEWTVAHFAVDSNRVYLAGMSGGGYMAMLLAARYPRQWTAVSAWVGISDLTSWYAMHAHRQYGDDMRRCFGGAPESGPDIRAKYESRSPLASLAIARNVPFDFAAGRDDGHGNNPVPIRQTLAAFNAIARAQGADTVSDQETAQLSTYGGRLSAPHSDDTAQDPVFARRIFLRRFAGNTRVTIFNGGHEWIPAAAAEWLGNHVGRAPGGK